MSRVQLRVWEAERWSHSRLAAASIPISPTVPLTTTDREHNQAAGPGLVQEALLWSSHSTYRAWEGVAGAPSDSNS